MIFISLFLSINIQGNKLFCRNQLIPQQEYRKQFSKKNDIDYLLNLSKEELESKLKSSIPKFPKDYPLILEKRWQMESPLFSMPEALEGGEIQRLILKLLYYSKGVQAVNMWDKKVILGYISRIGRDSDSRIKRDSDSSIKRDTHGEVSVLVLEGVFIGEDSRFMGKMFGVEKFIKKNNNSRMIKYQTHNYLGPYLETYKNICFFDKSLTDKQIFRLLKKNKTCELKKKLFKDINLKYLLKKIEYGDKQIVSEKYKKITPFVAKIILTEIILSKLNKKEQKEFYSKIINKTDFSEFTCGKFCNTKSHLFRRNTDLMIVHNGYQLLNSIKGANLLEKYSEILIENILPPDNDKEKEKTSSIGIECSLFLQRAIERTNISQIKGRMKTDYMDYSLVRPKIAKKEILNCEEQLKVGDIVKLHGHTYLFMGYKEINHHYYAVTIEATGGSLRSVGVFYRDFYSKEVGGFNKKIEKNGKIINVDKNERYVIYRLR